jgi:ABC-type sugar transport system permease subunit
MTAKWKFLYFVAVIFVFGAFYALSAQETVKAEEARSQEVSESDGIPVLIKHLPKWESVRSNAVLVFNENDLKSSLGDRPVFDLIDFRGGTEAVTAVYPEGKLLIVEYTNPQGSSDADNKIKERLAQLAGVSPIYYRRVGNYNAFIFDSPDEASANSILDQIKYEKVIQWLGEDPYLVQKLERYFVSTTRDIFIATILWIVLGLVTSILLGITAGFIFYRFRQRKRLVRTAFSDAGGLTRLNLDGLSE